MKIGGWKTSSVFKRYAIVDQSDVRDATEKIQKCDAVIAAATAERLQNGYSGPETRVVAKRQMLN